MIFLNILFEYVSSIKKNNHPVLNDKTNILNHIQKHTHRAIKSALAQNRQQQEQTFPDLQISNQLSTDWLPLTFPSHGQLCIGAKVSLWFVLRKIRIKKHYDDFHINLNADLRKRERGFRIVPKAEFVSQKQMLATA